MTSEAGNRQLGTKIGSHIIEQVAETIRLRILQALFAESLQAERLVREQEAEQGTLVLSETFEHANENRQHSGMQRIKACRHINERLSLCCAEPAEFGGALHRMSQRGPLPLRYVVCLHVE